MAPAAAEGDVATEDRTQAVSKRKAFIREASCHSSMLIAGWSDASSGPLIPFIQAFYNLNYLAASMLFVGQAIGFLSASVFNSYATDRLGFGKVIAIGGMIQAAGYVFLIPAFPFPIMPICYAIIGFGMNLQDAQANTYIGTLPNADYKFGLLHASCATVVPLAATAFASNGLRFSYFYAISLALALVNVGVLLNAFRFNYRILDVEPGPAGDASSDDDAVELGSLGAIDAKSVTLQQSAGDTTSPTVLAAPRKSPSKSHGRFFETLKNRAVVLWMVFIFIYVGSEVSMGGWIVSFLLRNRDGGPSAGYVATGFWGGLTLGRAISTPLNNFVGEKRVIYVYLGIATCLELAIWFADSLVGNAVTVAIVGLLIGPIYPICMSIMTKVLPRSMHATAIGAVASFGQVGSAAFPFAIGALATKHTPSVLQPFMIGLFAVQGAVWWFCPSADRKKE